MGSVLVDAALQRDKAAAEKQCSDNLGPILSVPADVAQFCEGERPEVIWGKFGMLHWLLNTEEWMKRLVAGNGIDCSGSSRTQVAAAILPASKCPRPERRVSNREDLKALVQDPAAFMSALSERDNFPDLASFDVNLGILEIPGYILAALFLVAITEDQVRVHPYDDFINRLCAEGADLLLFPYDWRLSNAFNATRLARAIHEKWWRRLKPADVGPTTIPADQRVTIVAHSMGGLLARFYIEAEDANVGYIVNKAEARAELAGHRYVRQLITVGTPHLGAPLAYTSFIGATDNFEEYSHLKLLRRMSGKTSVDVGDLPLSHEQQRMLMEHYASVIEMFPAYRFMPEENTDVLLDSYADFAETYRAYTDWGAAAGSRRVKPLRHSSRYWGWRMLAEFRQRLIHPARLDRWLIDKGLIYVCIANDGYSEWAGQKYVPTTVTGYDARSKKGPVISNRGDGVVPWKSATLYPYSDRANHIRWIPRRGGFGHNLLMQDGEIQGLCVKFVNDPIPVKYVPLQRLGSKELQDLVARLLSQWGYQSQGTRSVISVITLEFQRSIGNKIIPFAYENGRWTPQPERLPPRQIYCSRDEKEYVCQVDHPKLGSRPFAAIPNTFQGPAWPRIDWQARKAQIAYGGVVFLPVSPFERSIDVLTWNVGDQGDLQNNKGNATHAEEQFKEWFTSWFNKLAWRGHVTALEMRNDGKFRYSPCSQCVEGLQSVGAALGRNVKRSISWKLLYDGVAGETTKDEIAKLKGAGWAIAEGSPRPVR
jgi:hypothetical protein